MCLAFPGKIIELKGENALVDFGGSRKEVNISMVDAVIGDFVLVHVGFAIQKISEKDAMEINRAWKNE